MKERIKTIKETRILLLFFAIVCLAYITFECTSLKEITTLALSEVLISLIILFYPIRYLLVGIDSLKKMLINTPKFSPTFWVCVSIIVVGLVFCGTYYFVNKDNGRYQYESGFVIDKKTGEAKRITVNQN
jgi:hypothetical protein